MAQPTAMVTGGSRGIGRAIAVELTRTHRVIATYNTNREAAESLKREAGAEIFHCDIASANDRRALLDFARREFGHLDLLVNNAGIAPKQRLDVLEGTEESFDELIAINLKGPHFLTQQAARWMLESSAAQRRIVFITSISAYAASVNRAEYCMSKAALSMSTAIYTQRLAADGIKVFEIRPGVIRTDMIAKVQQAYEDRIAAGLVPQRRLGEPADVALAVRAVADGLLDYSTGQILNVDGGFHVRSL